MSEEEKRRRRVAALVRAALVQIPDTQARLAGMRAFDSFEADSFSSYKALESLSDAVEGKASLTHAINSADVALGRSL